MTIKHSIMIGLLGRIADRFHEYQPARPLSERLEMVRRIEGVDGIEPVYPSELRDPGARRGRLGALRVTV